MLQFVSKFDDWIVLLEQSSHIIQDDEYINVTREQKQKVFPFIQQRLNPFELLRYQDFAGWRKKLEKAELIALDNVCKSENSL